MLNYYLYCYRPMLYCYLYCYMLHYILYYYISYCYLCCSFKDLLLNVGDQYSKDEVYSLFFQFLKCSIQLKKHNYEFEKKGITKALFPPNSCI